MARQRSSRVCKHCGQSDLYWKLDGSSWRLATVDGKLHSCKSFRRENPDQAKGKYGTGTKDDDQPFNPIPVPSDGGDSDGDTSNYQTAQAEGSGEGSSEQGKEGSQEGSEGTQNSEQGEGKGESQEGSQGSGSGNNDKPWIEADQKLHQQVKWDIAQSTADLKAKLDARAARNEQAMAEAVNKHVEKKLAEITGPAPVIEVRLPDGSKMPKKFEGAHPNFPLLLTALSLGEHVMLTGPAGTGKTTAAEKAAEALGLTFYPMSVGAQTSKTDLLGYIDAHSKLVRTIFRDAFEYGGLFLLDEVDAGNANVLTNINAALANGYCSFPDGVIKRHESFRLVAAANTFGNGADRQYVGRNQLDAATLDRFTKIVWDYDTELETRLSQVPEWTKYVWDLRAARELTGVRCVFSTRAIIRGSKFLTAKVARKVVEDITLWNGVAADDKAKLLEAMGK